MTCIAAAFDGGACVIAADTSVQTGALRYGGGAKLQCLGRAVVGLSGSMVFIRALRGAPELGDQPVQEWAEAVADHLHAWGKERGHGHQDGDGTFLVDVSVIAATPEGVWYISCDGYAQRAPEGYGAIGSGSPVAMGALHATAEGYGASARALAAVRAAIAHGPGCAGPILAGVAGHNACIAEVE